MVFKVRHHKAGSHVHCSLFVAKAENQTYAKCGDFTIRDDELNALRVAMLGVAFEERNP
jgi:hypothetical protein